MKVALLGYGIEGAASYEYYRRLGFDITVCNRSEVAVPEGVATRFGDHYLHDLDRFDVLMRTAGMPPREILAQNAAHADAIVAKITTHVDEFLRVCPTRNIIGVTGTKGKGTTSTLITNILAAAGKQVRLGGNIGVPPLSFLHELTADSWVVLELSSFQLIDLTRSPHIGVCLMVVPEHLNWHADMAEYVAAKSQLFAHQTTDDVAIYFAGNELSQQIASAGAGQKLPYYREPGAVVADGAIVIGGQAICRTDELKLLGRHNWQNVCAAVTAAWQAGARDAVPIHQALTSFSGLPYHLEFIRELDGVRYYNDSFGTTPETAQVAVETFAEPKILIVGGDNKQVPFDGLAHTVKSGNVRHVVIIGNTANPEHPASAAKIETALRAAGYDAITNLAKAGNRTMDEIVRTARQAAQPGDVIVLTPAAASFDMFNNYKERGQAFTDAVRALS